ncbi:MAG: type II secretion system F family protein [Acidimicrobiia bacterium]
MRNRTRTAAMGMGLALAIAPAPAFAAGPVIAASGAKSWLIILGAAAAGLGAFLLLVILLGGGSSNRREGEIGGRLGAYGGKKQKSSGVFGRFAVLRRAASKAESVAESQGNSRMIESALEQANIPVRAGEAIIAAFGLALILGLIVGLATQSTIWAIVSGAALLMISFLYVSHVAAKQRKRFDKQLPETLNLLATSLRAGYSIMQAIEAVASEAPDPTRREFGRAMSEIRLGRPMIDALSDIADRMESQDFEWTVLAISIQREVGGNLAEVLQSTSETMLQRNRLRGEMKALTAEGRISMYVMAALPFGLFGAIYFLNPGYIEPMMNSVIGIAIFGFALFMMGLGIFWMTKIVKVDV